MNFTEDQLERYSRQLLLQQVGPEGQTRLQHSRVLIIGLGGLGSPVALYLAAAGVGTLGLMDHDTVSLSNLQRQILHGTPDVGTSKVDVAERELTKLNPDIALKPYAEAFSNSHLELLNEYDVIVDGTDNFESKFAINDACVAAGKPFVHAGLLRFEGQVMTVKPGHACFRCVFNGVPDRESVPTCSESGVIGPIAGLIGTIQATEVIKLLLGIGECLINRLLSVDALTMRFREIPVSVQPDCMACGLQTLDLRGVECPMNFVKIKVALSKLTESSTLRVILDDGDPVMNVTNSLNHEQQPVLSKRLLDESSWELVLGPLT